MITLNDYLYSGDTVLKILQRYHNDLKEDAKKWKFRSIGAPIPKWAVL